MRAYELMIIFDGDVEDTAVNAMLATVNTLVEAGGGTVAKTDRWGRRRFAYEINHKWEGIYVVLEISTEGRDLHEVERVLHIADEVVRHKVMRLPEKEAATGSDGRRHPGHCRLSGRTHLMAFDNTVVLVGNCTADPELRFTASGQALATFSIAVNRRWQNRQTGAQEEQVSFFEVKCWQQLAENVAETITKGTRVLVNGRLEQSSWQTKEGDKRYKIEVVADEVARASASPLHKSCATNAAKGSTVVATPAAPIPAAVAQLAPLPMIPQLVMTMMRNRSNG